MKKSIHKPRYIYQKQAYFPYQCGPFAIYNLLIKHHKYYDLTRLIKLCKATVLHGTLCKNMDMALTKINGICDIYIKSVEPTFTAICTTIKQNGSIILLFHWKDANSVEGDHYVMIESFENNKFKIINYSFDDEIKFVSSRILKTMLFSHKNEEFNEVYPKAWGII